jgi:hypothetical protein
VLFAGVSIALAIGGCSVSNQTETSLAAKGCKLDAVQICGQVRNHPVTMSNTGIEADQRMQEQNTPVTADIVVPINMPNNEPDITIHCGINTKYQSVSYASVAHGPAIADDGVEFLRSKGYCAPPGQ